MSKKKKRDRAEKQKSKEEKQKPEEIERCDHPVKVMQTCLFMTVTEEGITVLCNCCRRCVETCSEISFNKC